MSYDVRLLITRLDPDLPLPAYEHPGDAGLDLRARTAARLEPGQRALVPTGVSIALPPGFAAFVHARSGMALRAGLGVVNAPGVIDAGYRGEIGVILINHDTVNVIEVARGDRIAQLVVQQVAHALVDEVAELPGSHRGEGGFGSTGGNAGTVSL
ncbi:unannotated protein [freshwater metagenome]|uniref:dUTP diphosphatase n=1 Tax=freshwater metagenome TaxID=449393 RepID=A0A6J6TYB2_9ZZZZ|nr:dUTP diphosphatase [Actinomycetota bacterium]MSW11000.1 dUTP diphosphatase [Actinomycetota bacterium]MSY17529.1 dUTP diphosphatase [Actinomycetota bacterium]MSY98077.1 dUTP diphosphatase [Actinomycetota bacterium]